MLDTLVIADHIMPVIITVALIAAFFIVRRAWPYLHYIYLVAGADDEKGEIRLAKYLAIRTGGSKINVDQAWGEFIPAAQEIHRLFVEKKFTLN